MPALKNFEPRLYQQTITAAAAQNNTLVVLPTGLGKTAIALMLAIQRLNTHKGSKILILAPTRPLVDQHKEAFLRHSDIEADVMCVLTGNISPQKRAEQFEASMIIFSTPQGLENDVMSKRISLEKVSLIVFDEAHRAVGDYSYVWLAKQYAEKTPGSHILALTASPGSEKEKIEEVCNNLFIEHTEQRTPESPDVQPYVHKTDLRWIEVELDEQFKAMLQIARKVLSAKVSEIKEMGYLKDKIATKISRKDILSLQAALQGEIAQGDADAAVYKAISMAAQIMKIMHAVELLESQGIAPLNDYLSDLFKQAKTTSTKATMALAQDPGMRILYQRVQEQQETEHPKLKRLKKIIQAKLRSNPKAKIIVFNQYRDSIRHITRSLNNVEEVNAEEFVGQAKKKGKGLSQKRQIEMLKEFGEGAFNVIVMSSVGEEGLDIPEVDQVIFYEPIPSAIRSIQRRGRTGRHAPGQVLILVAKGTRDEAYRWSAYHKERKSRQIINGLGSKNSSKKIPSSGQSILHQYEKVVETETKKVVVFADSREKDRGVIKALLDKGAEVKIERLSAADYMLSAEIGVEMKHVPDFVDSIVDGRLLEQLPKLKSSFPSPLLVVQGTEDMYGMRNIHPHAIQGMLATIGLSFKIPILFTRNAEETASLFLTIAKKQQEGWRGAYNPLAAKPSTTKELQEFLIASIPGIGIALARNLLIRFRSIDAIVRASKEDLMKVDGIGAAKADQIRAFFSAGYEA
jgi:Fanconi anemia group M protein